MSELTPMMKQYLEIKNRNKDAILFFRLGDFYEMFGEDAVTASRILQITLTSRGSGEDRKNKMPMCGVPFHAANNYILKLINHGLKVAICEQVEDPKEAKGIVKREIIKIITPGTVLEDAALEKKANNYILSIYPVKDTAGLAYIDVSTGEFCVMEISISSGFDRLIDETERIAPSEVLIPESCTSDKDISRALVSRLRQSEKRSFINPYPDWNFNHDISYDKIKEHFGVINLEGYGIEDNNVLTGAAGALLTYIHDTQKTELSHINSIKTRTTGNFMYLDSVTLKNLDIMDSGVRSDKNTTLYSVLDNTETAMGGRELKKWLKEPLMNTDAISQRHAMVSLFIEFGQLRTNLKSLLAEISDIERIAGKLGGSAVNGRDLNALKRGIINAEKIHKIIKGSGAKELERFNLSNDTLEKTAKLISDAITEEPPITIKEGGVINPAYDPELAKIKDISTNGKGWIAALQETERKSSGIGSLKVGYTSVFGYYIEISKANLKNIPANYIRKQTLVNAERFITPELKEYESMVLGAQDRIKTLEYEIFCRIRQQISLSIKELQALSSQIAELDCLISFAEAAINNGFTRPEITTGNEIIITEGRHPVVENSVGRNEFIPNDCALDCSDNMIMVITGPNMAGKSTFMRQVCVIVIMAQAGSFVPAKYAKIGITDRIFTRIGAADYLARGQSTFMVEMIETANILNNATAKSLIVLDEVGRGTSTFDGVSIAWAVTEYIHNNIKAKTLFATHYYELTEIQDILAGVQNYNIQVKEYGGKIVFMRKIVKGSTDKSYGIHVAQLAGLPGELLSSAKKVLKSLEDANYTKDGHTKLGGAPAKKETLQPDLFAAAEESAVLSELSALETDNMTPLDALIKIKQMKEKYR
ncbi:MAG: DNA mismatch repair protein MutS [Candidatus Goldiibacteriota bacterium HGW-Goldbacteria-1]|nr:MAG: DNA mismatch repair protein MutS [Candidatus Goldiibacteriota bacterium HGW-Goldbacteria-1]